ncbi:hypothetical protein swp_0405 [Shewanella piezotolerans WP3]|uniref:Uncharacterized protein n=1 Tax=Shewanella piezotolerans (strain WP3 / JCM 13877) TaxID=225849 RepID=B8CHW1_SHEPW|nr:hypothetical protein swp_0405 [Shewanella piezotolerans WP3]
MGVIPQIFKIAALMKSILPIQLEFTNHNNFKVIDYCDYKSPLI